MSEISERPMTSAQIRSIHVAKAAAGLEDGEYRDMLDARFGCRTSKGLTRRQASELLATFGRPLPNPPGRGRERPKRSLRRTGLPPNVSVLPMRGQTELIRELAGRIEWREEDGLARWMESSFGWRRPRTSDEAGQAIQGLKAMCRRAGRWAE